MRSGWKRVHRLVVLPDYQGIGIGTRFIKYVASLYKEAGYEFNLTTTTPALVGALSRDDSWLLASYGRGKVDRKGLEKMGQSGLVRCSSAKRVIYSFWYKGR